jgi:hypothetical protein
MGRFTVAQRAPDHGSGVVDRSAAEPLQPDEWSSGDSAIGPPRPGSILTEPDACPSETSSFESCFTGSQVIPQVWYELPETDRQTFGRFFSSMILKALDLSSYATLKEEV